MSTQVIGKVNPVAASTDSRQWRKPRYSLHENTDDFALSVVVPGVNRDGIDLSVDADVLTIEAHRALHVHEGWTVLSRELPESDYRLSLRLNALIDTSKVTAQVSDGILRVSLPKVEAAKARKIAVN